MTKEDYLAAKVGCIIFPLLLALFISMLAIFYNQGCNTYNCVVNDSENGGCTITYNDGPSSEEICEYAPYYCPFLGNGNYTCIVLDRCPSSSHPVECINYYYIVTFSVDSIVMLIVSIVQIIIIVNWGRVVI